MDQRVRDGAGEGGRRLRTSVRVPATIQPVTGGEAIVAAPAAGRFAAGHCSRSARHVREGQALGRLEPRLTAGDDRATLAADVAEAQGAAEAARVEQARAERLLADRAVPARRVEEAAGRVTVAEARLRAAEARLAQREQTLGHGRRRGVGECIRAAGADCRPHRRRVRDARRLLRGRRAALQDRQDRRSRAAGAGTGRRRRVTRDIDSIALELPGRAEPILLQPHHHARFRRDRSGHPRADRPIRGRESRRALLIGQTGTAVLYTRDQSRCRSCPRRRC